MTIAEMQDELNETDVCSELDSLRNAVSDMECCECKEDFDANLDDAIAFATALLKELKSLKKKCQSDEE